MAATLATTGVQMMRMDLMAATFATTGVQMMRMDLMVAIFPDRGRCRRLGNRRGACLAPAMTMVLLIARAGARGHRRVIQYRRLDTDLRLREASLAARRLAALRPAGVPSDTESSGSSRRRRLISLQGGTARYDVDWHTSNRGRIGPAALRARSPLKQLVDDVGFRSLLLGRIAPRVRMILGLRLDAVGFRILSLGLMLPRRILRPLRRRVRNLHREDASGHLNEDGRTQQGRPSDRTVTRTMTRSRRPM